MIRMTLWSYTTLTDVALVSDLTCGNRVPLSTSQYA